MPNFIGEGCETQIDPELKDGDRLHILVTWWDNFPIKWWAKVRLKWTAIMQKRTRTVWFSNRKSETIGRLKLNEKDIDGTIPNEARVMEKCWWMVKYWSINWLGN